MRQFQKIVVGAEFDLECRELTTGARLAVDQALWLAERNEAHVTLVHSGARDEFWDGSHNAYVEKRARTPEQCAEALERTASRFRKRGIPTDLVLSDEAAWLAITHAVLAEEADMVVVGKRTEPGDRDCKLGSVALKLLRKCPAAVWAVDPDTEPTLTTILAATDLTPVGKRVLEISASLAAEQGSRLHVVHAFQMPLDVQMEGNRAQLEFEKKTREQAEASIRRKLDEFDMGARAEIHVGLTSPTRAILACVDRLEPDVVVMGTISRSGIPGILVGNTAERLLARLDCSLLTVKPADFVSPVEREASDT